MVGWDLSKAIERGQRFVCDRTCLERLYELLSVEDRFRSC